MEQVFRIVLRRTDEAHVVAVTGELDVATVPEPARAEADASDDAPTPPPVARAGDGA